MNQVVYEQLKFISKKRLFIFVCLVNKPSWMYMGWVEEFFQPLKKIQPITGVQPNPYGSGWTHGLDSFFLINSNNNIIIKLSIRKHHHN